MDVRSKLPPGVQIREVNFGPEHELPERPLVLLNGIGAGIYNWGKFPEAIGRPTIAVDVSKVITRRTHPRMGTYSNAVVNTIDVLGYEKVDLLGVSWGGALAEVTAERQGDRIGSLVLAATMFGVGSVPPTVQAFMGMQSSDRHSDAFIKRAGEIFKGDITEHPELLKEVGIIRHIDDKYYNRQQDAIVTWLHSGLDLRRIKNSTLIMAGQEDPIARPFNSRVMYALIRFSQIPDPDLNTRLHIVPKDEGGGHLFLHTRPVESARVVNEFLDSTPVPLLRRLLGVVPDYIAEKPVPSGRMK